jgi:hypothetical protein
MLIGIADGPTIEDPIIPERARQALRPADALLRATERPR